MARRPLRISVPSRDRKSLRRLLSGGIQPVRVVLRALALLHLAEGATAPQIAGHLKKLTPKAVRVIAHRYQQGGLERALYEKRRPGAVPLLDAAQKQRIIAMVCSDPPAGRARWTIRLIAEEAVKRKLVPRAGRETIRILLQDHDLQPWRKKMWCVAELNDEYLEKMEDVLQVYEKPYDPAQPVVCVDERPITLHDDVRPARPMAPGKPLRPDNEYKRCGTANAFCAVEPRAGKHFTLPTPNRSGVEFAKALDTIAGSYPAATTIHLVMDNLNIHHRKALTDCFGEEKGTALWDRFTVHYTPKHGSWLNQAEIEISLFARQCLGPRRIPTLDRLRQEAEAWNLRVNQNEVKINWTFTRKKARRKFGYRRSHSHRFIRSET